MENFKALSRFIQILDSVFPSGAFVHSFGLEPHIVLGKVNDSDELKTYLKNIIVDQYQKLEYVAVEEVYTLLEQKQQKKLVKVDNKYAAMFTYEYAKASQDMGQNYLKQLECSVQKEEVQDYFKSIKSNQAFGNEIFVLSAYAYDMGLDKESFLLLWTKKMLINIASCSLKISRIKPTQIQQLLFEFDEDIKEQIAIKSKRFVNFNPLFEEVILSHLNLEPKMFAT